MKKLTLIPAYEITPDTLTDSGSFIVTQWGEWPRSRHEIFDELVQNAVPDSVGFSARLLRPHEFEAIKGIATSVFNGYGIEQLYIKDRSRETIRLIGKLANIQLEIPNLY